MTTKKPKSGGKSNKWYTSFNRLFEYTHNYVHSLNNSKLFAGLMIIVLNIASKFVNIKLSKTMEAYLKYTFSRQILIFAIAWMGTRDIYIALAIMLVFVFFMDFLLNEESRFCILPEAFTDYHVNLLETNSVNDTPTAANQSTQPNPNPNQTKPSTDTDKDSSKNNSKPESKESKIITQEEIAKAKDLLERAKLQNGSSNTSFFNVQMQ